MNSPDYIKKWWQLYNEWKKARLLSAKVMEKIDHANNEGKKPFVTDEEIKLVAKDHEMQEKFLEHIRNPY